MSCQVTSQAFSIDRPTSDITCGGHSAAGVVRRFFLINGTNPTLRIIYAGSLDDPGAFRPGMNIFTASAHAWDLMDPDLPAFAGMPERRRPR